LKHPVLKNNIKTGIFGQPDPEVHLGQAWRIELSYRNIREYKGRSKGRVREATSRTRPFDRPLYPWIFLYENSISPRMRMWVCVCFVRTAKNAGPMLMPGQPAAALAAAAVLSSSSQRSRPAAVASSSISSKHTWLLHAWAATATAPMYTGLLLNLLTLLIFYPKTNRKKYLYRI
jgi:hypothetical protein